MCLRGLYRDNISFHYYSAKTMFGVKNFFEGRPRLLLTPYNVDFLELVTVVQVSSIFGSLVGLI
jgi:hypothetical protein